MHRSEDLVFLFQIRHCVSRSLLPLRPCNWCLFHGASPQHVARAPVFTYPQVAMRTVQSFHAIMKPKARWWNDYALHLCIINVRFFYRPRALNAIWRSVYIWRERIACELKVKRRYENRYYFITSFYYPMTLLNLRQFAIILFLQLIIIIIILLLFYYSSSSSSLLLLSSLFSFSTLITASFILYN